MKKITSILIANRAEISCRVIKSAREMGIKTYSLYTSGEENLPHVKMADVALSLGEGSLAETYLNQDKIISFMREHQISALHPGYGFLSENTSFAKKLIEAGFIFIGPSIPAITLMGSKTESKKRLEKIKTPLIPGYHGDSQEPDFLFNEAKKIGFPVLIKASAGGGGKGMREVHAEKDFFESLESAKREAKNAFSDDKVLLEKLILKPRHIEVQVFSDTHGNHVHLFERECSIQRRHQKIIEETPSPALSEKLRQEICLSAVAIAKEISYLGAGTVEYILDQKGDFYFLEMNTRLQVEHPITEMITGLDLVKWQIMIAEGQKLPLAQKEISSKGHAFEIRLYAEDPSNNFFPSIGKILELKLPEVYGLRSDLGYEVGTEISLNFDPMIGKIIVYDLDREKSLKKMQYVLSQLRVIGVKNNIYYLEKIFNHQEFIKGNISTHFISEYQNELLEAQVPLELIAEMIATLEFKGQRNQVIKSTSISPWQSLIDFRNVP
jgi:3-methylcrotonyl-CoA carboxylase alpha subunit